MDPYGMAVSESSDTQLLHCIEELLLQIPAEYVADQL